MALSFNNIITRKPQIKKIWVQDTVSTPTWTVSVADMIKNEEASSKENSVQKLNNYFQNRSSLRKAISNGSFTSWNKAQDAWEARLWKLVDLYLDASSKATDDNWKLLFSADKIIEESKNPSKVLKDMKSYYQSTAPDKVWAIDDYIQKWGMASNVFEYLEDVSGNIKNPYWKTEVRWDIFTEETPEAAKWVSAISNYLASLWTNIAGRIAWNEWLQDKSFDVQHKIWDTANDEEYKLYKSGKLQEWNDVNRVNAFGESKAKFYDDYEQAQKDWFIGSVDEYKNFKKNLSKATTNAVADRLKEWVLTEDDIESSKSAIAMDALTELVTYSAIPLMKKLNISTENPLINEIANLIVDATVNTAEFAWIESLNNNQMDLWELGWTEWINLLVNWITRSPVIAKYLKDIKDSKVKNNVKDLIAKIPERIKDAYGRLSAEQLTNIKNLTKNSARQSSTKLANQWVKYFWEQWVNAMDKSLNAYLTAWDKLGKEWQNLRNSGISIDLIESSMNKELKNLENHTIMWDTAWAEWTAPQIHINKKKNWQWTLNIENRDNLNMIKNWEWEWLADAMEKIFNWMFKNQKWAAWAWMELNEATLLAFMNEVKWATQGTEWSWGNMWAKVFWEWLDVFRKEAELPQSFLDAEKEFFNKKDLHNKLTDALGSYGKYSSDIDKQIKLFEAGQKLQDPKLQWVLELAQDAGYISSTVDAEIIAYGYMLALQDEAAARAFFGAIYPSEPWLIEAVLEWVRNWIREWEIDRYIRAKQAQNSLNQWLWWMADLSNWWREIYKTVWGWVNITKQRLEDNKKEPENKYTFTDEGYNDFLKSVMK